MAQYHGAVFAQKHKRLIRQRVDGIVDLFEIPQLDADRNHPDERLVGAVEAFADQDDFVPLEAVDHRLGDIDPPVVIILEILVI